MNAYLDICVRATGGGFFERIGREATRDYFKISDAYLCFPMFTHPRKRNKEANVAVLSSSYVDDSKHIRRNLFGGYGYHTNHYMTQGDCAAHVFLASNYPSKVEMYYWLLDETDFRSVLSCTDWIMGQWSNLVSKHGEDNAFKRYEKALCSFVNAGRDVGDEYPDIEDVPF